MDLRFKLFVTLSALIRRVIAMWKKLFGISAISIATTLGPGIATMTAHAQDLCPVTGSDQGNFDQQGDWQGQNVTLVPCGTA